MDPCARAERPWSPEAAIPTSASSLAQRAMERPQRGAKLSFSDLPSSRRQHQNLAVRYHTQPARNVRQLPPLFPPRPAPAGGSSPAADGGRQPHFRYSAAEACAAKGRAAAVIRPSRGTPPPASTLPALTPRRRATPAPGGGSTRSRLRGRQVSDRTDPARLRGRAGRGLPGWGGEDGGHVVMLLPEVAASAFVT